jgi:hypothetical protein
MTDTVQKIEDLVNKVSQDTVEFLLTQFKGKYEPLLKEIDDFEVFVNKLTKQTSAFITNQIPERYGKAHLQIKLLVLLGMEEGITGNIKKNLEEASTAFPFIDEIREWHEAMRNSDKHMGFSEALAQILREIVEGEK